jgi:hypothetical protein
VAKKLKKANGAGRRPRAKLSTVRAGSVRAKILALLAGGNRTADDVARLVKKDTAYVRLALHCLHRDAGIGFDVRADGRIRAVYPRGRCA